MVVSSGMMYRSFYGVESLFVLATNSYPEQMKYSFAVFIRSFPTIFTIFPSL